MSMEAYDEELKKRTEAHESVIKANDDILRHRAVIETHQVLFTENLAWTRENDIKRNVLVEREVLAFEKMADMLRLIVYLLVLGVLTAFTVVVMWGEKL